MNLQLSVCTRFWAGVNQDGPLHPGLGTKCWLWLKRKNKHGYGTFKFNKKSLLAHRFSWLIVNTQIQEGLYVLHHCDNPACVNPKHLFLGTQLDNINDMTEKGRRVDHLGESHGRAKLTDEKVIKIRLLYKTGRYTYQTIGDYFGVTKSVIGKIIKRQIWNHIL